MELTIRHVARQPRYADACKRCVVNNIRTVSFKSTLRLRGLIVERIGFAPCVSLAVSGNPKAILTREFLKMALLHGTPLTWHPAQVISGAAFSVQDAVDAAQVQR
ncbi:hypothetical protein JQX09_14065 [Sulfitobacter pseudonitzschiae]|uniref:Uncharacterized protein n=1 Tax=Pseudosulfitobacter pseudonitzschiae TaxID=1402135 RepID=A0A9Q2NQJ6_9RHOB|nr:MULTISPECIES: hypothetical protein [Roseobacteraceae]MBM1816965.1 hypothetical protein [Pseudosulfitobacter pseudonitzschiae]MBM1833978.1 hypothetical protein [Pseudosulfitobacter pseudonitzschiae]MBM1838844.1 hypothetical protein [Pseudosulfitobacter pseudonitzschiae]MBM1843693.1 hypothetical protein [Pseudosulfitobacter pseudonitzschiae]MBM1848558.1 hypothetical protein [Pseudosulfitobacter pseudonitzschiae]